MYTLQQLVLDGQRSVDETRTPFGIRTASFDRDRGFLLNGERVKLNGVNVHEDAGSVGTAVPVRMWERRFEVLKAMGVNAIRTAHNPFAPEFLDLADRMGFLVMDEAFDEWTAGKVEEGYHRYFDEWSERDLTDFVRRDRNHPSVVLWSAGNEIGEQSRPNGHEVLRRLMAIIHREDPTRAVTTGNDQIAADGHPATEDFLNSLDVVGYNYVDRWHERRELYAEEDRHRHPEWKMIGTESSSARGALGGSYSLGGDSSRVQPNYTTGMIRAEELWKWVATHDYFAGDFMWTGIDYLGETRWPSKGAGAGAIDIIGFPKDAYYLYQSQWTGAPVLHLFPHWNWPGREGQLIPVLAYTNCTAVELFLNGRSMGEKRLEFPMQGTSGGWNSYARPQVNPTTTNLHLTWDVPYEPGVLRAAGRRDGGAPCEAEVRTAGPPAVVRLTVDRDTIAANPDDVAHATFEIVDANGTVVPDAANRVLFTIEGGSILALDNADLRDRESNRTNQRRAFHGQGLALVQATRAGRIRLTASSDGLQSAVLEIVAVEGDLLPVIPSSRP
jgi:beta-galactosidase